VFKVALLALLDLPLARFWVFPFALCGITVVEIRNGRPRLRLHNATDHLSSLETEAERAAADARRRSGAL
jgi:broad specificity phosphatase PhoE